MSNSNIWNINRKLSGATIPGQMDLEAIAMKYNSAFPQIPALEEPCHKIV